MRGIESQSTRLVGERRLSVWTVGETHFLRRDLQITAQQQPQKTTAQNKSTPMLLEVKPARALALVRVQRMQKFVLHLLRLLQTRTPHVYFTTRQRQRFGRR